jgi:hypothetical protein
MANLANGVVDGGIDSESELFQEHPKFCNELKYKCDKCAYKFSNQRRLTKHIEKEHNLTAPNN